MVYTFKDNILFVRFDDGEDFFETLVKVLKEVDLKSGVVMSV
ncbi:DNA-binding protein [Thermosipho ferrireducens]|nr:DNA-binding protein [Thermosipho ferrireducens]